MLDCELLATGCQLKLSNLSAIDWGWGEWNIIYNGGENNYYPGIILTKKERKKESM